MESIRISGEVPRYPIPPDLTMGRYIGGYTMAEITVIGTLALLCLLCISVTKSWSALPFSAIPAALAVLLHRRDNGYGYINPARTLWVQLRYFLADAYGAEQFSLRQYWKKGRLDEEDKE